MTSWFDDPKQLIRTDKVLNFWPSSTQSSEERVNSAARFIIYATCIIYLIKRDVRIFVIGATALGVLYIMEKSNMVKESLNRTNQPEYKYGQCQMPTKDNPMGNVLMSDFGDRPDRPSSCYYPTVQTSVNNLVTDGVKYGPARSRSSAPEHHRNAMSRQFVSVPDVALTADSHYEFIHGKREQTCRQNPHMCNPDARGVQLEAFRGLDPDGDSRVHGSRAPASFSP